jgi:putative peptide zinc metalloprotease protein
MTSVRAQNARAVSGIQAWDLFPGTSIVGNCVLDRYVTVPSSRVPVMLEAIHAMDGQRTLDEIACDLRARGFAVDTHQLHDRLWKAGLIEGAPYEGDVTRFSSCWASIETLRLFQSLPRSRELLRWLSGACALLIALAIWVYVVHGLNLLVSFRSPVTAPPTTLALVLSAGIALSVIAHEGAHGLTGSILGAVPTRLRILGYFGFIPCFILTIPGLYTLSPKKRIAVWIAGPLGSLMAASCSILIGELPHVDPNAHLWLARFAAVNAAIALYNCCPLLPTDGYFVLSTLLGRANMRAHAWREWRGLLAGIHRRSLLLLIYGFASAAVVAIVIGRNIRALLGLTGYSVAGYAIVAMLAAALGVKRLRKYEAGRK